jgi:hypothetical protein
MPRGTTALTRKASRKNHDGRPTSSSSSSSATAGTAAAAAPKPSQRQHDINGVELTDSSEVKLSVHSARQDFSMSAMLSTARRTNLDYESDNDSEDEQQLQHELLQESTFEEARDVWEKLNQENFFESKGVGSLVNKVSLQSIAQLSRATITTLVLRDIRNNIHDGTDAPEAARLTLLSKLHSLHQLDDLQVDTLIWRMMNGNLHSMDTQISSSLSLIADIFPELPCTPPEWKRLTWRKWVTLIEKQHHVKVWTFDIVWNAVILAHEQHEETANVIIGSDGEETLEVLSPEQLFLSVKQLIKEAFTIDPTGVVNDMSNKQIRTLLGSDFFDVSYRSVIYGNACGVAALRVSEFFEAVAETWSHWFKQAFEESLADVRVITTRRSNTTVIRFVCLFMIAILGALCVLNITEVGNLNEFVDKYMYLMQCKASFGDVPTRELVATTNFTALLPVPGCDVVSACEDISNSGGSCLGTMHTYLLSATYCVSGALPLLIAMEWATFQFVFPTKTVVLGGALISNFLADPRISITITSTEQTLPSALVMGVMSSNWQWSALVVTVTITVALYVFLFISRYQVEFAFGWTYIELLHYKRWLWLPASLLFPVMAAFLIVYIPVSVAALLGGFPELYTVETIFTTSRNGANTNAFAANLIGALLVVASHAMFTSRVANFDAKLRSEVFDPRSTKSAIKTSRIFALIEGNSLSSISTFPALRRESRRRTRRSSFGAGIQRVLQPAQRLRQRRPKVTRTKMDVGMPRWR